MVDEAELASMGLGDSLGNGEAKARPASLWAAGIICPDKWFEYICPQVAWNPDAIVAESKSCLAAAHVQANRNRSSRGVIP